MKIVYYFVFFFLFYKNAFCKDFFALVNKSYKHDLDKSLSLYQSVERHFKGKLNYYLVVPAIDMKLFKKTFSDAKKAEKIKQIPHFLTDEYVFQSCGVWDKVKKHVENGWHQQQIIKLCFYKTNLSEDYLTLDSDIYFTKDFDTNIFYNKKGFLKTVGDLYFKKNYNISCSDFNKKIRTMLNLAKLEYSCYKIYQGIALISNFFTIEEVYNFISGFALWSSENLKEMEKYFKKYNNFDMADLILISPWEMQWYGTFVMINMPYKFELLSPSKFLWETFEPITEKQCISEEGLPDTYGIINHSRGFSTIYYKDNLSCKFYSFMRRIFGVKFIK